MHLSMWTYPWDIQDQGLGAFAAELRGRAGLSTVNLATSYHAGRFLQPRSPRQKAYFPEDGTVYFQPDESLWQNKVIQPPENCDYRQQPHSRLFSATASSSGDGYGPRRYRSSRR